MTSSVIINNLKNSKKMKDTRETSQVSVGIQINEKENLNLSTFGCILFGSFTAEFSIVIHVIMNRSHV